MQEKQWLLLVICAMCSEAAEQLKVPYDFAAYPSYKSYYKLRQNDKFLYKNPKVSKIRYSLARSVFEIGENGIWVGRYKNG